MTATIQEIIVRTNFEERTAKAKLEVEESGREVARLQGNISGYKKLIAWLSAAFHLSQGLLEDNGEEPMNVPDLDDDALRVLEHDAFMFQQSPEYQEVVQKTTDNMERLKTELLFTAKATRDLDVCQGEYTATVHFESFFQAIKNEVARREKKRKDEEDKGPALPF